MAHSSFVFALSLSIAILSAAEAPNLPAGGSAAPTAISEEREALESEIRDLKKQAQNGEKAAQVMLGMHFEFGKGVAQDYAEAAKWYRKAADQGDATAQLNLGFMHANGRGVEKDYVEAAKWYRKAAERGDASAQFNLGVMMNKGQGVEKDYVEAAKWCRKAADQGDASAQFNLGFMHANGQGVEKDYVEAYAWYNLAGAGGNKLGHANRDALEQRMSALQVAEAQKRTRELKAQIRSASQPRK